MHNSINRPPRLLSWILQKLLNSSVKYGGIGDFQEQYNIILQQKGRMTALSWYFYQIIVLMPSFSLNRLFCSLALMNNYFRIGFRNIMRNKTISLIIIVGMSLGIGVCLFLFVTADYIGTFNKFHVNLDQIYRITSEVKDNSGNITHFASTPFPWAESIKNGISEVKNTTKLVKELHTLRYDAKVFSESVFYADQEFLNIFTFNLLKGDKKSALSFPNTIVLTERAAKKYFGDIEPIGKEITIDKNQNFKVTGILEDIPNNSIMFFDFLLSSSSLNKSNYYSIDDWKNHTCHTFLLANNDINLSENLENKINFYINSKLDLKARENYKLHIQKYEDILYSLGLSDEWLMSTDPNSVNFFYITAAFILLIACINFMNLSTAKSSARAKEVGMRKVFGAKRNNILSQFLSESFLITTAAFILGLVLATNIIIPWYNSIDRVIVPNDFLTDPGFIAFMLGFIIFVSIAAGSYPAFYLSLFNPVKVLKGDLGGKNTKNRLRQFLVVTQFFFAVLLIISNFIVYDQVQFLKNSDLGFDKNDMIYFVLPPDADRGRINTVKDEILRISDITSVSNSSNEPGDGFMTGVFRLEDTKFIEGLKVHHIAVDENHLNQLDIQIINGRNFSLTRESELSRGVIINKIAVEKFGWQNPVGKKIEWLDANGVVRVSYVIGITNDFHYSSLHFPIQPLIMHYTPQHFRYFLIKLSNTDLSEIEPKLKGTVRTFFPDDPINYYYLEEDLNNEYILESTISLLLLYSAFITIFIACLGLIGMASFTTERRTKEIAVRKILGCSVDKIFYLVTGKYIKYIITANLIAGPLSYFMMKSWLESFANRITINPMIFIYTIIISAIIVLITISYQVIKASFSNPVKSLRYE